MSIQIGPCSPEVFERGKEDRVQEEGLTTDSIYSWFSLHGHAASIYPSRIHHIGGEEAPDGLVAIRFAILSANLEEIKVTYSLFEDGLYRGQRNGLPLIKHDLDGGSAVEEGYFQGPIKIGKKDLSLGTHGHRPAAQALA